MDTSENVGFIYDYSLMYFDRMKAAIASLNTRLGVVIGFAGVGLRFASELDGAAGLSVAICVCAGVAMLAGFWGLAAKGAGSLYKGDFLMNEYIDDDFDKLRLIAAQGIQGAANELAGLGNRKTYCLNLGMFFLLIAAVCYGAAVALSVFGL